MQINTTMLSIMSDWNQFLSDVGGSSSATHKQQVIKSYENNDNIKQILVAIYNPYIKYNTTEKAVINTLYDPHKVNPYIIYEDIFELCNGLNERQITGHEAIHTIIFYMMKWDCRDLMLRILKRDLKLRIGVEIINKAIPDLIPVFNVQLGEIFNPDRVNFSVQKWVMSHKLDGLRCLGIIEPDGTCYCKTRSGLLFNTLQVVLDELKSSGLRGVVFDGELCIVDENGKEDFQQIMKVYNKKGDDKKGYVQIEHPKYLVFDIINYDDFIAESGDCPYDHRLQLLKSLISDPKNGLNHFEVVEQIPILSDEHLGELMLYAEQQKWEGLYIKRLDLGYKGDRTWDQQKVKIFEDIELIIVGYEIGPYPCVINGQQREVPGLLKVFVDYKGNTEVKVGSGFSLEERIQYAKNPKQLIGKEITVKHGGETKPEKGKKISLKWPVKKYIWLDGKRNV
jgi:DNA ligase-1